MGDFVFKVDSQPESYTFKVDEDRVADIKEHYIGVAERAIKQEINKQKAIDKRLKNGLKLNRVTSYELRMVLDYWFKSGMDVLQKAFNYVYENTGKRHKEYDWCKNIPKAKHYGNELITALNTSDHHLAILIRNSILFDSINLKRSAELTTRIREMDVIVKFEKVLEKKDSDLSVALARIAELEGTRSWKEIALEALALGKKQKEVAKLVGKSVPTIKRLVADNKK